MHCLSLNMARRSTSVLPLIKGERCGSGCEVTTIRMGQRSSRKGNLEGRQRPAAGFLFIRRFGNARGELIE